MDFNSDDKLFEFIFEPSEFQRIITCCLIDGRATIPDLANKTGVEIKAYTDIEVNKVKNNPYVLFFKIETVDRPNTESLELEDGVLAGYFSLFLFHQGAVANLYQLQIRPSFTFLSAQISIEIGTFISTSKWKQYYL